jgi:hypothetical protein
MIAPLQTEPERRTDSKSPRLVAARAALAAILLRDIEKPAPPIPAWQAWGFIAWVGFVTVSYALFMSGMFAASTPG